LLKGLQATIGHLFTKKVTVLYPEVRRELPQRSRGLIRMRLKEDAQTPRCVSCTFCEQICPAVAIKVVYDYKQPGKVWSLDAGSGPMLAYQNQGEKPLGLKPWPQGAGASAVKGACLASAMLDAGELTEQTLTKTALGSGVWLSQVFGVATFYDQLGPGAVSLEPAPQAPETQETIEGCPAVLLANHGVIDPESIDAYAAAGGYKGITRIVTEMAPAEAVEEIALSGLRGRGGAGFPTARKWRLALETEAPQKYIICNADESDPGSFKDRSLLENNPHAIIEGMIVAGYAVGATQGIIFLSAENSLALERIRRAVDQAEDRAFLDDELPGTDFSFSIRVIAAPGTYTGGEETALISALEGKRPTSRPRPPYPAERGLHGMPTVVDNAETLACIPWIINHGARAFQKIGAESAPGTKLFTLTGAVSRPGLYEATLDTSLKKLAMEGAGGFASEPKAALVGSAMGGFLSPGLFDIPLDFDSVRETGGDLSSGTIEVLGHDACIVEKVRDYLRIASAQSCGKCVPCRVGTWRLLDILERMCAGQGDKHDLELAAGLAEDIRDGALCGLGRGAVRPLLTGLKFFHDEFAEHAAGKTCAAGKCGMK
jgi:NADH:ubiquinone oxidoreductase subunit F (NADH-binding)